MKIITHHCNWTNTWFVYDDNYCDDYTPHGVGSSLQEAIESLEDTMETYFERYGLPNEWQEWISEFRQIGAGRTFSEGAGRTFSEGGNL